MATECPALFTGNASDAESTASEELTSYQNTKPKPPNDSEEAKARGKRKREEPNSNKRQRPLSERIKRSKEQITKLKLHTENQSCPTNLRYTAKATIDADRDFKHEVYRIKRRAELDYLKAIIKFHYRDIDRLQKEQKQNVKNPISTQSASRNNVTELEVTKFEELKQELNFKS